MSDVKVWLTPEEFRDVLRLQRRRGFAQALVAVAHAEDDHDVEVLIHGAFSADSRSLARVVAAVVNGLGLANEDARALVERMTSRDEASEFAETEDLIRLWHGNEPDEPTSTRDLTRLWRDGAEHEYFFKGPREFDVVTMVFECPSCGAAHEMELTLVDGAEFTITCQKCGLVGHGKLEQPGNQEH